MKAFVAAVVVSVALAFGAYTVINQQQVRTADAFATDGARVGDPGHNLVGPEWTGLARGDG